MMKKAVLIFLIFILSHNMFAQNRTQPIAGPLPKVILKKPQKFTLKNGLTVLVVEDHKLPRVSFNLIIDNPPFAENNLKGVDEITSNLMGAGTKSICKDDFLEEIDFMGASINITMHNASAASLTKYSGRVLQLLASGALQPLFTQAEFEKEKAKLIEHLHSQEKSVSAISNRVVNALTFGTKHPFGEFVTEETLNSITLNDVIENYNQNFVPNNAYLVIIGDVEFKQTKPIIEQLFGAWQPKKLKPFDYINPENVAQTQINFVDVPNAVQSEIALVHHLTVKLTDPDYFPTMMAIHILGGDYNSYLNMNIREAHGWAYGASTSMSPGKYISKIKSSASVRNEVTDSAVVEFVKEIKRIRTQKITEKLLNDTKASYIGRFIMNVEKPNTIARYALNIETDDLPHNFYEKYIEQINSVTAEQILAAAQKHFLINNTRIIIVGKGSDVVENLKNLEYAFVEYDKYGRVKK
jgi:zinc protease